MKNFKLKIILSILGGIVFSLLLIILAFALPAKKGKIHKSPKNKLEKVSKSLQD